MTRASHSISMMMMIMMTVRLRSASMTKKSHTLSKGARTRSGVDTWVKLQRHSIYAPKRLKTIRGTPLQTSILGCAPMLSGKWRWLRRQKSLRIALAVMTNLKSRMITALATMTLSYMTTRTKSRASTGCQPRLACSASTMAESS